METSDQVAPSVAVEAADDRWRIIGAGVFKFEV
jgi:hypothetical protein